MPAPLRTTVPRPCERNPSNAMAASTGDFPADSGRDRMIPEPEAGAVSWGILIVRMCQVRSGESTRDYLARHRIIHSSMIPALAECNCNYDVIIAC